MTKPIYGKLTPRELDVLGLLDEDLSYARIAEKLGISQGQVNNCLSRAREKMQAGRNSKLAAKRAREDGQLK